MTSRTSRKKGAPKKTVRSKRKDVSLGEIESSVEEGALTDFARSTKEELRKLGDKLHEATDKGVHVAKDIAEDVQKFARNATELTKIKIELHNLKAEREKLFTLMGEQLRNLYRAKKLSNIKTRFKADFARLDELESLINEREKMATGISLSK